jgi:hypothetical protein
MSAGPFRILGVDWLILLAAGVAAAVALSFAARASARRTSRGSGVGVGMLGAVDEIFAPNRYERMLDADRQSSLPAPAPAPGDGDLGVYEGRIRIRVTSDDAA